MPQLPSAVFSNQMESGLQRRLRIDRFVRRRSDCGIQARQRVISCQRLILLHQLQRERDIGGQLGQHLDFFVVEESRLAGEQRQRPHCRVLDHQRQRNHRAIAAS